MKFSRCSAPLLLMCGAWVAGPAQAVDGLVLEVRELSVAGIPVRGASVRLDVLDEKRTRLTVRAASATVADPVGTLTELSLICDAPVIAEPRYACDGGRLTGRGGPTGNVNMNVAAEYDTKSGITRFSGSGLDVAGTTAKFDGQLDEKGWRVQGATGTATIAALRKFAAPWFQLPADITGDGKAVVEGGASDEGRGTLVDATLKLDDVELTNEASTIVTVGMAATARLRARLNDADTALTLDVSGSKGQVLVNPVLLDFGVNPLSLSGQAVLKGDTMTIAGLHLLQKNLVDLTGTGSVNLGGEIPVVSGDFKLNNLEFPAAYSSYMAITLASVSLLANADTAGSLHGELSVRGNAPTSLHMVPTSLTFQDKKDRFHLAKIDGEIFWTPAGVEAPYSKLSWSEGGAFGLSGGAATMEFVARGPNFALMKPTKLPILDGGLSIDTLAMGNLGSSNMEVTFEGEVEPISMPRLAKVFGWPEFQGTLAAKIPEVKLKDNLLTIGGIVESQVFGGRVAGSNIRIQDPLGNYPQFFADVRARDLDLGLVTRTFEVGSITGRLEADVLNLNLYAWTLVSFDARLATPKGDKSRHRISAKAVSSLSNVGGGGGGVVQALQSGVLRFFDDYSYDKLGISCKLRNDVCEMSGIEPAGIGYYIVKGAGLPRIDIIGNAGRVRWSQLLASIPTDTDNVTVQ
ncbi:MAG TPA: hypothetical protein VM146_16135 [Steroidobacteraceae bacterium]|nr:hypothetical protein [Steroidobacteraceae bacterium]